MTALSRSTSIASLLAGLAAIACAGSFTYTTVDDPSAADGTVAYGINNAGQIVGYYRTGGATNFGFIDNGGTFTTIIDPAATGGTSAYGINDAGQIVGSYVDGGSSYGFLDNGGTFTTISVPGAANTFAYGINDAGQIVGFYQGSAGVNGFLDNGGVFTTINEPSSGYNIIGGINNVGDIVGYYEFGGPDGLFSSFLLQLGTLTPVNDPAASLTFAAGINDSGQIVGSYSVPNPLISGGVLDYGFLDSGGIFTTIGDPTLPGVSFSVFGINDAGQMVGSYENHGFLATPTASSAEPSTLALAFAATFGLTGYRVYKRFCRKQIANG